MTPPFVFFGFSADLKDEEAVKKLTIKPGTKSKLPKPVQELVGMIFDVESMKKALVEYEVGAEPGEFSCSLSALLARHHVLWSIQCTI